jgi:hypothetical protein
MIEMPEAGMKVKVTDKLHCYFSEKNNYAGNGVIVKMDSPDSFLVKMDRYPNEALYRCRECVERT